jgi:aspartyl/asparaginyl-tRNA synthetase
MAFVGVREAYGTVQVVLFVGESISKGMVDYAAKLPKESIIEVVAHVIKPNAPIEGCS